MPVPHSGQARLVAVQAATEALKAATTADDAESLNKALKHFEELCKPGMTQ